MKALFTTALLLLATMLTSSFTTPTEEPAAPKGTPIIVTTGANGEIENIKDYKAGFWCIRDVSGYTNIRNRPGGKVCMRLKPYTQYIIFTDGASGSWLRIESVKNESEDYWVRLHGSSTGRYWISKSVVYYTY